MMVVVQADIQYGGMVAGEKVFAGSHPKRGLIDARTS